MWGRMPGRLPKAVNRGLGVVGAVRRNRICRLLYTAPVRRQPVRAIDWATTQLLLYSSNACCNKAFPVLVACCLVPPPPSPAAPQAVPAPTITPAPWARLFQLRAPHKQAAKPATSAASPVTVEDCRELVAGNMPVFWFHKDEKYFPCTVEWFLERCQLAEVAKGWRRRVVSILVGFGALDGEKLAQAQRDFDNKQQQQRRRKRRFLQLQLDPSARGGQDVPLDEIPVYAHVKETVDPILGRRDGIEINYMTFLAYNGPYKLFHWLYVGPLGAHDADWEHVTVRLSPDGQDVRGVYYSAHRHRDGMWQSADEVPLTESRRPRSYIAENGHGSYPVEGTILRLFVVINDYTGGGRKWDPKKCVLITRGEGNSDKLPSVLSRGSSLNNSSYPSPHTDHSRPLPTQVERQNAPWLEYEGKWGGDVDAPQKQEWFARAEHPVSRTWIQQIFFPLLPGVESIWEPAVEEVEEALEELRGNYDKGMDVFKDASEGLQEEVERTRKSAERQWRKVVRMLEKSGGRKKGDE